MTFALGFILGALAVFTYAAVLALRGVRRRADDRLIRDTIDAIKADAISVRKAP